MDCIYHGSMIKNTDAWGTAKGQFILSVLFLAHIFLFIVNNGNILTYGTGEIFKKKIQ